MSYMTGTAQSFSEVKQALSAALRAAGWDGIGSGAAEATLDASGGRLILTAEVGGQPAPGGVMMADLINVDPIVWPLRYEVHVLDNPKEAYCVINYNVDRYQYLAMGVSPGFGIPGSGVWISGTMGSGTDISRTEAGPYYERDSVGMSYSGYGSFHPPIFGGSNFIAKSGGYWHDGLDAPLGGDGWCPKAASIADHMDGATSGNKYIASLLRALPSQANFAATLLPIYGIRNRPDNGASIGVALAHARYCRIDHLTPGEIISYGADRWMIYPDFRKNAAVRNGKSEPGYPLTLPHSGTYGWAVRYTGD